MLILRKCCCCSLKSGVILLGILSLIVPVFLGGISMLMLLGAGLVYPEYNEHKNNCYEDPKACQAEDDVYSSIKFGSTVFGVLLAISAVYVMTSSCLIHGATQSDHRLLIPYMILVVLTMVLEIVGFILFYLVIYTDDSIIMPAIFIFIGISIHILIFLYVFSLSQEIRSNSELQNYAGRNHQKMRDVPLSTFQLTSSNYQSTPFHSQQLAIYYQQPPSNYQQPKINYQQPLTNYQQPPMYYQQPQSNYQQRSMNYQPPMTNYQKPYPMYPNEKNVM